MSLYEQEKNDDSHTQFVRTCKINMYIHNAVIIEGRLESASNLMIIRE